MAHGQRALGIVAEGIAMNGHPWRWRPVPGRPLPAAYAPSMALCGKSEPLVVVALRDHCGHRSFVSLALVTLHGLPTFLLHCANVGGFLRAFLVTSLIRLLSASCSFGLDAVKRTFACPFSSTHPSIRTIFFPIRSSPLALLKAGACFDKIGRADE